MTKRTKHKYFLTDEKREEFENLIVLDAMVQDGKIVPLFIEDNPDDACVVDAVNRLYGADYVDLNKEANYFPTEKGREVIRKLKQRYYEYLKIFDVYCAVDLETGEFALASYYDERFAPDRDPKQELWNKFLADDRWWDLRVAVAEFKNMSVLDTVFMALLSEHRFRQDNNWEFNFLTGEIWKELIDICNNKIHCDQMHDDVGTNWKDLMTNIVNAGTRTAFDLLEKEQELEALKAEEDAENRARSYDDDIIETETVEYYVDDPLVYYDPWWDPFYVPPLWMVPIIII